MEFDNLTTAQVPTDSRSLPPKLTIQRTIMDFAIGVLLFFVVYAQGFTVHAYNNGYSFRQVMSFTGLALACFVLNRAMLSQKASAGKGLEVRSEDVSTGYTIMIASVTFAQLALSAASMFCWYMLEYSVAAPIKLFPMTPTG